MGIIEIERDGKLYQAEYFVEQGVVSVLAERGNESTQLGGLSELQVAKLLLSTIIRKDQLDPVGPIAT